MPLKFVHYEDSSLFSFCNHIKKEDNLMKHSSIEETKTSSSNSLVLGEIVKVLSHLPEEERYIFLVREFLPNNECGDLFKATVEGVLARELAHFSPQAGDKVAFLEPRIFTNPEYEPKERIRKKKYPKYLLINKYGSSLMWFTKTQEMQKKSVNNKCNKQIKSPDKSEKCDEKSSASKRKVVTYDNENSTKQSVAEQTSDKVQPKPDVQLPHNIKSKYQYKTIDRIVSTGRIREHNVYFFGVVKEILKPLSTTANAKFSLICNLVDDSDATIKFHFFVPEDTILKQIAKGDILRLHRVKLELYNDIIDGRVFFSHDVVLFKKEQPKKPISVAKNLSVTDEDIHRVEALKEWFFEHKMKTTLLSDISARRNYCLLCKVLHSPREERNFVTITVTDGSAITALDPALPMEPSSDDKDCFVTEITAFNRLDDYARLKEGDFAFFYNVEAYEGRNNKLWLRITTDTSPKVVDGSHPAVTDLESRIQQSCKRKTCSNDSEHKNETSVQTRQQTRKSSPVKNVEKSGPAGSDNSSCLKPRPALSNNKDDEATRTSDIDPGTKSRKQLYTPNYRTDLSDAGTEESSERNVVMANKVLDEDVVDPANTNFNDIVEKVKTKYCTPKTSVHITSPRDKDGEGLRSPSQEGNASRKRAAAATESQEDDTETVLNCSYRAALPGSGNKRPRLDSAKAENNQADKDLVVAEVVNRGAKVTSWLLNPDNSITPSSEDNIPNDDNGVYVVKQILCGDDQSSNQDSVILTGAFRTRGFLFCVIPDPSSNPLDLVSGYCASGCQQLILFSFIKWQLEGEQCIPLCPQCFQQELVRELQLMFIMELLIIDFCGNHRSVTVMRNEAEQFLKCTVREYLMDEAVREARVHLLTDHTVKKSMPNKRTPVLDVGVMYLDCHSNILTLVNSTLKLPD